MKTQLILRELNSGDESAFLLGYEDWKNEELSWYSFVWSPGMSHAEHLQILQEQKDKSKLPTHRVPSTMLYGFVNGEIVGRFNIRHELNQNLLERGGHVGYAVSPRHRKKGYATQMFMQGMRYCKDLGLSQVLVTCADQNVPSWKIKEQFGGCLENRTFDEEEREFVRRYWVNSEIEKFDRSKVAHKAIAYITRQREARLQLLVFDHDPQFHDAGTQVPSGTVDPGESPKEAVLRETHEESGLGDLIVERKLDHYQFFSEHSKKVLCRHVFHLTASSDVPDRWTFRVQGDGADRDLNFHYYWIDLDAAKGRLSGRLDESIDLLNLSMEINLPIFTRYI